jgi:hypothetical protein
MNEDIRKQVGFPIIELTPVKTLLESLADLNS